MSKLAVVLVLIMHTIVYLFLPQPENAKPFYRTGDMNSYDNFFVEKVLKMQDKTPYQESDDVERVLQIVHVEDFFKKFSHKDLDPNHLIPTKVFFSFNDHFIPSASLEVILRPPKA